MQLSCSATLNYHNTTLRHATPHCTVFLVLVQNSCTWTGQPHTTGPVFSFLKSSFQVYTVIAARVTASSYKHVGHPPAPVPQAATGVWSNNASIAMLWQLLHIIILCYYGDCKALKMPPHNDTNIISTWQFLQVKAAASSQVAHATCIAAVKL